MKADLVIVNGKVATVDKDFSFCQAIAVRDGRITDLGTSEDMRRYVGTETEVLDLGGKVILPAANDSHLHAAHTGLKMGPDCIDLGTPDVRSVKDVQQKIAQKIVEAPPGAWIYGMGFSGMALGKQDLDPVSPNNPVMLNDFSLHALVANSEALRIAGIGDDHREPRPCEGSIGRDPKTGKLTGVFGEWGAQTLVGKHAPVLSDSQIRECIARIQKALNSYGITSHTDMAGVGGDALMLGSWGQRVPKIYEEMREEGKLTARVSINVFAAQDGVQSLDSVRRGIEKTRLPRFLDPNWVKADAIKMFADKSYWARDGRGRSTFPGETHGEQARELTETVLEVHKEGWQIAIHAIGGRSIDTVVDAYALAQRTYPRRSPRHIVLHADDMTEENIQKMSRYGIVCSPQPIAGNVVAWFSASMATEGEGIFAWQDYMDRGVVVAAGSDAPCYSLNWLEGLQFALTRNPGGRPMRPDLAVSLEDGIRMYTINGAIQEHMEHSRGTIEVGKVADFQVLGEDIFTVPKESVGQIPVVMTICDGKIVYQA